MRAIIGAIVVGSTAVLAGCGAGGNEASASDIMSDILHKTSTGSETSRVGHALCVDPTDLLAFIQTSDYGSDAYKTREAQQQALFEQNRCTFIAGGVHYDVDAEGREIFHTPHGTIALWPAR